MKVGKRTRLAVEVLEDRAVPAVAASVLEGSLVVTGDSSSKVVITATDSNADKVAEYKAGKQQLFGFFVGQTMKAMAGKANPGVVNERLRAKLG